MGRRFSEEQVWGAQAPAAAPAEPGWGQRVNEFTTGINRGMANIAGLPVDIITSGLNALTGRKTGGYADYQPPTYSNPLGGSQSIKQGMEAVGIEQHQAVDRPGRVIQRAGEELGAASLPMAGLLGKGAQVARTGQELSPIAEAFVKPFVQAPAKAAATETALATGAGIGAGVAREVPGFDNDLGDIGGALAGGLATGGVMTLGNAARQGLGALFNPEKMTGTMVRDEVGRLLYENTEDPIRAFQKNIDESKSLEKEVPGFKLTTGQASADPGLLAMEYSRATGGKNVGAFQTRRSRNNQAANQALEDTAPAVKDDAAPRAELERRREKAVGAAQFSEGVATHKATNALEAAKPEIDVQQAGRDIRDTMAGEKQRLENIRDEEALPLLARAQESGAQVDAAPIAAMIDDMLTREKRDSVRGALTRAKAKLNKADSEDLDDSVSGLYQTRKAINDMIEGKGESKVDMYAKRELLAVRDKLDDQLSTAAPEFADYLSTYKEGAKKIDPYREGPTGKVLDKDLSGRPDIPDSEVAAQFWNQGKGNKEALQEFEKNAGGNEKAQDALLAYAREQAVAAATKNGKLDQKALDGWIRKNESQLNTYPHLRKELSDVAALQRTAESKGARAESLTKSLDSKDSTIGKYLDSDISRDSIDNILKSKNPAKEMDNLVRSVRRDPKAIDGLKRAMWDRMTEGTTQQPKAGIKSTVEDPTGSALLLKPDVFRNFMKKNKDALDVLYKDDPEHLRRLQKIVETVSAGQRTSNVRPPGSSGTVLGQRDISIPGLTFAGALSRGYALSRGVVSPLYVVSEIGGRVVRRKYMSMKKDRFEELLDRALLEPELAKTLAMEWSDSTSKVVRKRLRLHLGNEYSKFVTDEDGEEEKAPPKKEAKQPLKPGKGGSREQDFVRG